MARRIGALFGRYRRLPLTIRGAFWFLMCSFLQKGIAFITTPIFTRLLTTEEYGQYSVFVSWQGIVTVFVTLNLAAGVYTQGLVKFEKERYVFTSSLQGLVLALTVAWTLVYLLFKEFWNQLLGLTTVQVLAMLVTIWASTVFGFWSIEQRVDLRYRRLVALTLVVSIVRPLVGIFLVTHANDKVTARILGIALVDLVAYVGLFIIQARRGRSLFSKKFWKYAVLFNLPLIPHYLSVNVLSSADRIMISNMVGASQAGIYSLAYSISQVMMMFNAALLQTMEPWLYKKIHDRRIGDIAAMAYPCFGLIAVANLALVAFAPEAVALFAPPEYHEAIYVIPPIAMGVFFNFFYTFFATFEFYYEKTSWITAATVGGAVLNIGLNWLLVPVFGYVAAGYTTLFCYIAFASFHYWFMNKICRENLDGVKVYDVRVIMSMSAVCLLAGFALLATYDIPAVRYAMLIASFVLAIMWRGRITSILRKIISVRKAE